MFGLASTVSLFLSAALAQQYAGDIISAQLPAIAGSEVAFFRINDKSNTNKNLTLINYYSHASDGNRIKEENVQRAIIVLHGLLRDPYNYENDMLDALAVAHASDANISVDSVAVMTPFFPNGNDKNWAFPWTDGLPTGQGSQTNALVWSGSQWSAGANNQYPSTCPTMSSFEVLDQLISYFDDKELFPNVNQIVLVGHSLGGQMLQRYAAVSELTTKTPVTHWIGNPDSFAWFSTDRPLSLAECPEYDEYRAGYTNFDKYGDGMTYGTEIVAKGREALIANYQSKQIAYGRALLDHGDHSSDCGANTTGADRHERFFYFIFSFPPTCDDPSSTNCDTVDLINVSHDNGQMFHSPAGIARLFTDNFYGDGARAYDFGYPRAARGDNPYTDPAQANNTDATTVTGNWNGMTYQGCWTDQSPITAPALPVLLYDNLGNSIEGCTSGCQAGGYGIAGLMNGTQCYCGNALKKESAVPVVDSSCLQTCPGNGFEICGSYKRLSVFSAAYPMVE